MSGAKRYGFDDEDPIDLPPPVPPAGKPNPEQAAAAVEAGRGLGFVPREVKSAPPPRPEPPQQVFAAPRKAGRRRGEPRTQLLINGPSRVIDVFRDRCEAEGITYWEAIEDWLKARPQSSAEGSKSIAS